MKATSAYGIKRDLDRYTAICKSLLETGKIDKSAWDRQIDAVIEVEMAIPLTPYGDWNWTDAARQNLAKIRAYLSRH